MDRYSDPYNICQLIEETEPGDEIVIVAPERLLSHIFHKFASVRAILNFFSSCANYEDRLIKVTTGDPLMLRGIDASYIFFVGTEATDNQYLYARIATNFKKDRVIFVSDGRDRYLYK